MFEESLNFNKIELKNFFRNLKQFKEIFLCLPKFILVAS